MHYSKAELLTMMQDAGAVATSSKKLAAHSGLAVDPTAASSGDLVRLGDDESMRGLGHRQPAPGSANEQTTRQEGDSEVSASD